MKQRTPARVPSRSPRRAVATPPRQRPPALLLRLRERCDWNGVTRELLQQMADRLNLSDTETVHVALANLARDLELMPPSGVVINPTAAQVKGMDFSGLRRVAALAGGPQTAAPARPRRRPSVTATR